MLRCVPAGRLGVVQEQAGYGLYNNRIIEGAIVDALS